MSALIGTIAAAELTSFWGAIKGAAMLVGVAGIIKLFHWLFSD